MALKKSYAAKIKNNQIDVPQRDVDMHPFEEAETLAQWALNDEKAKIPSKPTQAQEHEWLLDHDAAFVKQKRAEWQKSFDDAQPEIQRLEGIWREAEKQWNLHAQKCHMHGLDYDTHPDGRNLPDIEGKK
jgi:hypothetical protein